MAAPELPPELREKRSDEREVFGLINALRRLLTKAVLVSNILDVIGETRGSVLYRGADGWAILPPGAAGTKLTSNGAGADPTWT